MHLAIILSIFLFLEVNPTDADIFNGSGTSCKPNKLQPILESSMQKVLREFGFNNSQNETDLTDAAQTQDCPSDWFRILDSCLWVSPPSLVLNAENATSYCQTMPDQTSQLPFIRTNISCTEHTCSRTRYCIGWYAQK